MDIHIAADERIEMQTLELMFPVLLFLQYIRQSDTSTVGYHYCPNRQVDSNNMVSLITCSNKFQNSS